MINQFSFDELYTKVEPSKSLAVLDTIRNTNSILSRDIKILEKKLSNYIGAEECLMVCGAQQGIYACLVAAGVGQGENVLCSGFAPEFVKRAIEVAGATPMLVDINPNTYNIDPFCLEYVIGRCIRTRQPIPKIIVVSNSFGLPANLPAISEICKKHRIVLIEDITEAFGGEVSSQRCGSFGDFAVMSLFAAQSNQSYNGGSAIFCKNPKIKEMLEEICGLNIYDYHNLSTDKKLFRDSVRAGYATSCLDDIELDIKNRQRVAGYYKEFFGGKLKLQQIPEGYQSSYSQFVLSLPNPFMRDELVFGLKEEGVPCSISNNLLDKKETGDDFYKIILVNTASSIKKLIKIPIFPNLSKKLAKHISERILERVDSSICNVKNHSLSYSDS